MPEEQKNYLVVGLGRFGTAVCGQLVKLGQHIIGVDQDRALIEEIADTIDVAAQLDSTDESSLVKVGARDVDVAIVTIGRNIEASIMTTATLKDLGVPFIVARANSAMHAKVLARVGANRVVFPEKDMGVRTANTLVHPWMVHFATIAEGDFLVGDTRPLNEMIGRSLLDLDFVKNYHAIVVMIERDGKRLLPRGETTIEAGDRLWLVGQRTELEPWLMKMAAEAKPSHAPTPTPNTPKG